MIELSLPAGRRGEVHDLVAILERLCEHYFDCELGVSIRWGRRTRAPRRDMTLGRYWAQRALITINPVLDARWVPRYFVEHVVFHESLHHVHGVPELARAGELHSEAFRASEARYRHHAKALAWEARNVGRLLRAR